MSDEISKSNSDSNLGECKCDLSKLLENAKQDEDKSRSEDAEEISFEEERYRIYYPKKDLFETPADRLTSYRPEEDRAEDIIDSTFRRCHFDEPREVPYKPQHYEEVIPKPIRLPKTFLNSKMFEHIDFKNRNVLFYEKDGRKFLLIEWKPLKLTHEQIEKVLEYKRKGLDLWELDFLQVPKPPKLMGEKVTEKTTFLRDDLYLDDNILFGQECPETSEEEEEDEDEDEEDEDEDGGEEATQEEGGEERKHEKEEEIVEEEEEKLGEEEEAEEKVKFLFCFDETKKKQEEKVEKKIEKEKSAEKIGKHVGLDEEEEPRAEQFVKKPLTREEVMKMIRDAGFKPHQRRIRLIDRDREIPHIGGRLLLADSLHFVKDNSGYLLELKDAIYYLGKVMKHVFEAYIDEGFRFIAKTNRMVINKKLLHREIRIFNGLYKRLSNACRNFLQIYIEEYRRHMYIIKAEAEKFLKNIKLLIDFQPKEILEKYRDCIKEFVDYLERDDEQMMAMKGVTWDDKPKFRDNYSRFKTFEQKSAWVLELLLEVLDEIKCKYIAERGVDDEGDDDLHVKQPMTKEEEIEFLRDYFGNEKDQLPRRKQNYKPFDFHPL